MEGLIAAGLALVLSAPDPECLPVPDGAEVLLVVEPASPALVGGTALAGALVAEAAPFRLVEPRRSTDALEAEEGLRARRARVVRAERLLDEAERSFSELEDRVALELVAEATPLLVASQVAPGATRALARAHLLAGAIYLARGRVDAATARLLRALDIDPDIAPPPHLRLLGVLEAVRAQAERRGRGILEIELVGSTTSAEVRLDDRPLGLAPGRFEGIPEGRHLIRISAPERRSHVGTVAIEAGRETTLDVHLPLDKVRAELRDLGPRVAAGVSVRAAQERLSERAGVDRTLIASVVPSARRGAEGELGRALVVDLEGAGRARIDPLDLRRALEVLEALASCTPGFLSVTSLPAPPLPSRPNPTASRPKPTPSPEAPWRAPWFWGLAALAALGLVGGLAVAEGAGAAPESVDVTLVPRP